MNFDNKALLLAAVFLAAALPSMLYYTFAFDEYAYMNLAEEINAGNYLQSIELYRPPLWPVMLAFAYQFFGPSEVVTKLLSLLVGAAGVGILYLAVRKHFGEGTAGIAGLLYATNSFLIFFSGRALTEPLYMTILAALLWAIWESEKNERALLAVGALSGMLLLARYTALALLPAIALVLFYSRGWSLLRCKWAYAGGVAFLLVLSPYLHASFLATGDPLKPMIGFSLNVAKTTLASHPSGVPDRIPSYILFLPATLGFAALPTLAAAWLERKKVWSEARAAYQKRKADFKLLSLAAITAFYFLFLEFGIKLKELRYSAVVLPLACVLAALLIARPKNSVLTKVFHATLLLNLLAGVAVIAYFGGQELPLVGSYRKQADVASAGAFLAQNCNESIYSNADAIALHYTKLQNADDSAVDAQCSNFRPQCIFKSWYEDNNSAQFKKISACATQGSYDKAFAQGGAEVYLRKAYW